MVVPDPVAARWPGVRPGRGHYESYYLRAVHPTEPRGVWLRYTVTIAPHGRPEGQLWFTLFDRETPRPRAVRVDAGEATSGDGAWIRLGRSSFGAAGITGEARTPDVSAAWSLRATTDERPLLHLPRRWMYTARLPRTKLTSPAPTALFDGTLEVDGETITVDGWPGMIGHNWGEQHAERWIWLHGLAFDGTGTGATWLDVAVGRVRLGPVVTPWVANGALSLAGTRIPLGGLGRRVGVTAGPDGCELRIPAPRATVTVSTAAPTDAFVAWDYANPDGAMHQVLNCSVADLTVRVDRRGHEPVELSAPGRGAYELGRPAGAPR
ncbi:MAG: hypothetical protein ACXVGE_23095 [Blastococcus sp.]